MGMRIQGNTSGNFAEVDDNNNMKVALPDVTTSAGYVVLAGNLAAPTDPTGRVAQALRVSAQGRLSVGQPVMQFNEVFNATAIDTGKFKQASTTQTITQAGGTINLNAAAITTLNTYCAVSTYQYFPLQADFATAGMTKISLSVVQLNNITEIGFMQAATNAAPTDGAFFRYDLAGTLKCVLNNNGTEYMSAALNVPSVGVMHKYRVVVKNSCVLYYIDDACQAIIPAPTGLGRPMYAQAQPFMVRHINGAAAPALANVVKIGYVFVSLQDAAGLGKNSATVAANNGRMGSQGQSGHTMGSTALSTNNLAAGAGAAMTNTTAALGVGLGGQFTALPTLVVATDGIASSYQNPAATAAIPGKILYIQGVRVQGAVVVALTGGPVLYQYSLAYGHTNVSLATAEGAGAKAPRKITLGYESFVATAAAGTLGASVYMPLNSPIAVNPGEFVQLVAKNMGVVTTAGAISLAVAFDSYWE